MILLYGKERFLKDEAIEVLKKQIFSGSGSPDTDFQIFDGTRDTAAQLLDFLSTAPFLSPKRLAICMAADELSDSDQELVLKKIDRKTIWVTILLSTHIFSISM